MSSITHTGAKWTPALEDLLGALPPEATSLLKVLLGPPLPAGSAMRLVAHGIRFRFNGHLVEVPELAITSGTPPAKGGGA